MNEVRGILQTLTKVSDSSGTATGSLLTGNYGVQLIGSQLKDVITDLGLGFTLYDADAKTGDLYSALSQIGITTDADESSSTYGMLILDEDALDEALAEDPNGVAELFAADYQGESQSGDFSYLSRINGKTKAGSYKVEITTGADGKITSATITASPQASTGTGDGHTAMRWFVVQRTTTRPVRPSRHVELSSARPGKCRKSSPSSPTPPAARWPFWRRTMARSWTASTTRSPERKSAWRP